MIRNSGGMEGKKSRSFTDLHHLTYCQLTYRVFARLTPYDLRNTNNFLTSDHGNWLAIDPAGYREMCSDFFGDQRLIILNLI